MARERAARLFYAIVIASIVMQACAVSATEAHEWFIHGRPTVESLQAVRLLQAAGRDGLDPDDYQAHVLARAFNDARQGVPLEAPLQTALSNALSVAMARFIQDMHSGRVSPHAVHASFGVQADPFNPSDYLRDAIRSGRLPQSLEALRPQVPLYEALLQVLARYRVLVADPVLQRPLPPPPKGGVGIGQAYTGLAELASKLVALGDLPRGYEAGQVYDQALADAVTAFQERHGLTADGVAGRDTFAQLNKPLSVRIRQIEMALERLRWTPSLPERMLVVNIPEFVLRGYRTPLEPAPVSLRIVVGRAPKNTTPLFVGELRYIEFSPYWNIPSSIARNEILPALLRDPASFSRQGFEFVAIDGTVTDTLSNAALDQAMRGALRLRQRPGLTNPLGRIKFVMPNNANIYLHDTPSVELFRRSRRDFSHGCIRVEDPLALARFVLEGQAEWSDERILDAMQSGKPLVVRVRQPIPVVIAYATAIVKGDGRAYFFDDIYGNDALLDAALLAQKKLRTSLNWP